MQESTVYYRRPTPMLLQWDLQVGEVGMSHAGWVGTGSSCRLEQRAKKTYSKCIR